MKNFVNHIFLGVCLACVVSEDGVNNKTKSEEQEGKGNYTPNDLIQYLSILADEEIKPRLRFPSDEYDDDPFYQSNLNTDEVSNNNYQNNYLQQQNNNNNYQNQQNDNNYQQQLNNLNNYQQEQQQYQSPYYHNYANQGFFGGNGISDQFPPNYPQSVNQDPQIYRPQKVRRPKKQKQNRYRPQFPIAQDPLDPYYQNYPPFNQNPNYPVYPQRPGFPPTPPHYPGPYPPGFQGQYPGQGPFNGFMDALNSIAKNDDQQCVPRLLCEVAAGGNPSYRQTSFLPSFLNTESLFTLLSALSGSVSPLLVFGRAALLGVTSQGRPTSCRYAYPQCPTDPDRLVEYLNNHNGGFFRFFNGLQGLQGLQDPNQNRPFNQQTPQLPSDQTLLNLFNQIPNRIPQNYPGQFGNFGSQNQRPAYYDSLYNRGDINYRRYPVVHNYQTRINQNSNGSDDIMAESRILTKHQLFPVQNDEHLKFVTYTHYRLPIINDQVVSVSNFENQFTNTPNVKFPETYSSNIIPDDNRYDIKSTLKFPEESNGVYQNTRNPKGIYFPNYQQQNFDLYYPRPLPFYDHTKMIFPDRTGTGNLKFDSDKLNPNYNRPDIVNYYSQNPQYYDGQFSSTNQINYYRREPLKKRYVYIVRGNGDPNHPEIVEDVNGRSASADDDKILADDGLDLGRENKSWLFPSAHEGKVYSD